MLYRIRNICSLSPTYCPSASTGPYTAVGDSNVVPILRLYDDLKIPQKSFNAIKIPKGHKTPLRTFENLFSFHLSSNAHTTKHKTMSVCARMTDVNENY